MQIVKALTQNNKLPVESRTLDLLDKNLDEMKKDTEQIILQNFVSFPDNTKIMNINKILELK